MALEVATETQHDFPDGTRFVDLAPCRDPTLLSSMISAAIGLRGVDRRPSVEALKRALQRLRVMLVLDNFEHVLAAAPLIAELLAACPGLTVLATSRAPLRLTWEYAVSVPPLELPDLAVVAEPETLVSYPSVALLLERMGEAGPGGAVDLPEARVLVEICGRLGGIPLAIELAAARARLLSPRVLLARLGRPLAILTGGARDHHERHQGFCDISVGSSQIKGSLPWRRSGPEIRERLRIRSRRLAPLRRPQRRRHLRRSHPLTETYPPSSASTPSTNSTLSCFGSQ